MGDDRYRSLNELAKLLDKSTAIHYSKPGAIVGDAEVLPEVRRVFGIAAVVFAAVAALHFLRRDTAA